MTTDTNRPTRYLREHGLMLLSLAAIFVWLVAPMVEWAGQREIISWSAFAVAVASWGLGSGRGLEGWRAGAGAGLAAVLAVLSIWLGAEFLSAPAWADTPATYREAMGDGACATSACTGHEAGWRWAEERGVADPNACGGRSPSFAEGCRARAAIPR